MPIRRTRAFITTGYSARKRWPPPGSFQSGHGLPPNGKAGAGTITVLSQLAPAPRPVPVATALLTVALTGMILLGTLTVRRRREHHDTAWDGDGRTGLEATGSLGLDVAT